MSAAPATVWLCVVCYGQFDPDVTVVCCPLCGDKTTSPRSLADGAPDARVDVYGVEAYAPWTAGSIPSSPFSPWATPASTVAARQLNERTETYDRLLQL